ncbi:META domain-containing protein [Phytoactinopolyspora mesophila]|uniref:META domain-containing protein n=1 Tax=Phytoactinopolyspora mesophila TaxID=2650750 RepID=A0A7K3M496_9ACTN|nr:META domain-containing protein [Phytoactinopolyspora mesophila]NDL58066.1 META domain-containing protein [Phytoactinopolyspora mesophila]
MISMERAGGRARPTHMRRLRVLIAVAGVVAVAACGNNGDDDTTVVPENGPGSETEEDAPLMGTQWRLDSLTTNDTSVDAPDDADAFVVFEDTRIGGNTGCNSFGGDVEAAEDDSLTLGPVIATKRACLGEIGEIDSAMLQVLREEVTVQIDGDRMTLTNAAGDSLDLYADGEADIDLEDEVHDDELDDDE